ncbi:MAG: sulfatase [bacterium]
MRGERPDIIVVVSDTLRTAHLGCYGNRTIRTPNIDAFARESVVFESAYPESLPTIPVRRALHTGRRAYPFRNYTPIKWDIVYLPGWQPISNDEDTIAENLAAAGYHTGFVSDTLPYFQPGMNFTRGFRQWEFIRGQQQDRWKSPATVDELQMRRYGSESQLRRGLRDMIRQHVANTSWMCHEEDHCTARVFRWAMDFIEDNRNNRPFYLFVDCFDPHEPWEAPKHYWELYRNPEFSGRRVIHPYYDVLEKFATEDELEDMIAHYSGLVTFVDAWFGRFLDHLKLLGLYEDALIIFTSDHGTNFADNPERVVGKPAWALYPAVMHIPLIVHFPEGNGAGERIPEFVYNVDIPATVYDIAGVSPSDGIHGRTLSNLISGGHWAPRPYLTSRYGDFVWYRDEKHWVYCDVVGERRRAFAISSGGALERLDDSLASDVFGRAWDGIMADAGGDLPDYSGLRRTEADGQKPD